MLGPLTRRLKRNNFKKPIFILIIYSVFATIWIISESISSTKWNVSARVDFLTTTTICEEMIRNINTDVKFDKTENISKTLNKNICAKEDFQTATNINREMNRNINAGREFSTATNTSKQIPTTPVKLISKHEKALEWCPPSLRHNFALSILPEPYLIENKHVCASADTLDVVFLVSSAPEHLSHRMYIRQTWGNQTLYKPQEVRVVFVLGLTRKTDLQWIIHHEHAQYSDIVQGKFEDTYMNITHKTVLGLRWASENCMHSKLVVKVDDDVFVNMEQFLEDAKIKYTQKSMEMFCMTRPVGTCIIERDWGKSQIGFEYFKNLTTYPFEFCNGFFVGITTDLVPVLYNASKTTPILRLDDVWLTGILPTMLGNITVSKLPSLAYEFDMGFRCLNSTSSRCAVTALLLHGEVDKDKLWTTFVTNQNIESNVTSFTGF